MKSCRYRFKERAFILLFIGSGLGCFPLFIPSYFIPIYARAVASQRVAVIILAMWNIASTIGRVLAGFLADTILGPLNSLSLSLILAGVSALAIWPFANSVAVLSVFIVLNGLGCGAFFSLIPAAVGSMFGAKNTMGVLPILWAGWFFGYFFVRPLSRIMPYRASCTLVLESSI
jgi:MFS family permease